MERVTIKLWEIAWALWEDRNESKHRKENLQTTADLQQLDRTISHLYNSLYGTLPDGDSYLFATPLNKLLNGTPKDDASNAVYYEKMAHT